MAADFPKLMVPARVIFAGAMIRLTTKRACLAADFADRVMANDMQLNFFRNHRDWGKA
jgi:hypothetical protein